MLFLYYPVTYVKREMLNIHGISKLYQLFHPICHLKIGVYYKNFLQKKFFSGNESTGRTVRAESYL